MKNTITPEEHARIKRRRWRQTLGLLITVLVLIGFITVLRAGVGLVANLFDDTAQKQEYEDKLEGLVLFDPMPFDGIENIDDLTLREAAVWGCVYSIQETQGGFENYNTDPETEQLLLPSVEVDAYLAKLLGPGFKLTHRSFDMEDMTVEFDETTQCYKIPITGTVGYYRATVVKLFKRSGKLHVTVGYIPTASADDSIINPSSDTPTKYMDYLFERQSGSWYLTGLTESETKPESAASSAAAQPEPMAESDVQDAILATAGDSAAADSAAASAVQPEAQAETGADSAVAEAPPLRMPPVPQRKNVNENTRLCVCFHSRVFFRTFIQIKPYHHQPIPQVGHHVPDHPQFHQDVVGQIAPAEGTLVQFARFEQGKGLVHALIPSLAKALLVELVALEQIAQRQRDKVEYQHQQRLVFEWQQNAVAAALLAFKGVVAHSTGAGTADVVALGGGAEHIFVAGIVGAPAQVYVLKVGKKCSSKPPISSRMLLRYSAAPPQAEKIRFCLV